MTSGSGNGEEDRKVATIDPTVIDGVPVDLEAVLGLARVTIGRLASLRPGETVELQTPLGGPVEIRLNGQSIAAGELVAVGDNFGVRITRVGS